MRLFLKVQLASIAGSLIDYSLTILLVGGFHVWYLPANAAGNMTGCFAQFILCRYWAFGVLYKKTSTLLFRFVLVFTMNILLSALGIYLLTSVLSLNYLISKTTISILLGISFNYQMQKRFVFRDMAKSQ